MKTRSTEPVVLPPSALPAAPPEDKTARPRSENGLSYRTRLVLGVCSLVLLTGATVTWLAHGSAHAVAATLAHALLREVSGHAATHTRSFVLRAVPIVESLRQVSDQGLDLNDSDRLAAQLLAILKANPGLSWVHFANEAGTFTGVYRVPGGGLRVNQSKIVNGKSQMLERTVQPDGTWAVYKTDQDTGYDPRKRPYYKKAVAAGRVVWVPPYMFFNQNVPGITCSAPVYDKAGQLRGVLGVDFDLNALSEFVRGLSVSEHSSVFLFTEDQVLLAHPKLGKTAGKTGSSALPTLADTGDPVVDAFRAELRSEHIDLDDGDDFHLFEFNHDGTAYLGSATTFRVSDDLVWVVGVVAPKSDFLADVWRSQTLALAVAGVAVLVAVLLAVALARHVSRPVLALIQFMRRVGEGDLEAKAEFAGSREFRQLSDALNRMIADLRDRLRLRHSLGVAMQVQQQLLPRHPPKVRGLDVAGHSTYCEETGGDYYDFLMLDRADPNNLLVALGDVMGHGVAAALVMAGTRAVLRDRADTTGGLADLMGRLNRLLASDLQGERFMTMHLSVINAQTGTFRWVSAGHDPALLYDPASDQFEETDAADLPLGVMDDTIYEEHSHGPLRPGQVILVGTDGVWEMPNTAGEQFGKDRLREALRGAASGTAEEIVQHILERLTTFRGDCRPVDDVTFVIIKMRA
jgi:serine phosphatase RsbU (regulator of sigma subunit)